MAGRWRDPEQQSCWDLTPPRPDDKRYLEDDTRTGNAGKDGYSAVGPRRPRSATAGDIMDAEDADRYDEMDKLFGDRGGFLGY